MRKKNLYNRSEIVDALNELGIKRGDILFSHSNIGFFGRPESCGTVDDACSMILGAIFDVIGETGTFIVPTFTYSFSNGRDFNWSLDSSQCGVFTDYIRNISDSHRSVDPNVSVSAIGALAKKIVKDVSRNSYGRESFFDRFLNENGKILNMNFDAGSTFIHYAERVFGVDYRFDKSFCGNIVYPDRKEMAEYSIYVRDNTSDSTLASFEKFDRLVSNEGFYVRKKVGRGFVGCISAVDTLNVVLRGLNSDREFLIKGGCDV